MPLLTSAAKDATAAHPEDFALACRLCRDGAVAESYRLFATLEKGNADAVPLQVNLALCLMRAEQWQAALERLDKALSLLKRQAVQGVVAPMDDTYAILSKKQAEGDCYLSPMDAVLPQRLPDCAKRTIQRLQVDVCAELELWDRVKALGGALAGKGYANVERALGKAPK